MNLSAFLYRRVAGFISCTLSLPNGGQLSLKTKHEVASASDVFFNPFYWHLFNYIEKPPSLIVDCGANCGHFTV